MPDQPTICPLCNISLEERSYSRYNLMIWKQCSAHFAWSTLSKTVVITHYTIEKFDSEEQIERLYVPPYRIVNAGKISTIHKLIKDKDTTYYGAEKEPYTYWKFIAEVPQIKPTTSKKMLERISILLNFL